MDVNCLEIWEKHNEKNLLLLKICHDYMNLKARARSRTIEKQFLHMIKVRKQWLKAIRPLQDIPDSETVMDGFNSTSLAVLNLIQHTQSGGKVSGIKNVFGFITYLISHESHHREQILLTLKLNGVKIARSEQYAFWKW